MGTFCPLFQIMAYKKQDMIDQAVKAIEEHELIFIEEIFAFVPYSKATFYDKKLDESDTLKKAITESKIKTKSHLRKQWRKSDNPTLQIALYKLIGSDEEAEKLNGTRQKVEHTGQISTDHRLEIEFIPLGRPIATDDVISLEDLEKLKQLESRRK